MKHLLQAFGCRPYVYTGLLTILVSFGVRTAPAQEYEPQLLNKGALFAAVSIVQDFDRDGDLDILVTRRGDPNVPAGLEWLENDGTRQFPRHEFFRDETLVRPGDLDACDCDNDGDVDYIVSDRGSGPDPGQLFWLQRQDDGTFIKWTIESGADFDQADVADFDGDGNQDIVAVGFDQSTVNLYLNDGNLNFTKRVIADEVVQVELVEAEDIDDDGDVDIVFDPQILWNNGNAEFEPGPQLFTWDDLSPSAARGLAVADLNNDGTKDILTFSGVGSGGLYFLDGSQGFDQSLIERVGIDLGGDILVADIDENGLQDIIRQNQGDDFISILYQDQSMAFRSVTLDLNWDNRGAAQMALGDLDEDGDLDLVFPENGNVDGDVSWYENIDGALYRHHLYMELEGAGVPKFADIDNDGDLDVVLTVTEDIAQEHEIIWFENRGDAGFIDWRVADSLDYPADVEVADIDGDGSLDLVATARDDDDLLWFRNGGITWDAFTIEANANVPLGTVVADIDADGDLDVALTSSGDAKVFWYVNDGTGSFVRRVVDANLPNPLEVEAADLDDDGDMDLAVVATNVDNPIAVYLNDGEETFTRQVLQTGHMASDVEVGDWDGNGLPDILVSYDESQAAEPDVDLVTNDGAGTFAASTLIGDNEDVTALTVADMDDDGDVDLVLGRDEVSFNIMSPLQIAINESGSVASTRDVLEDVPGTYLSIDAGDVNGDGILDLVTVDSRNNDVMLLIGREGGPNAVEPVSAEIPARFALAQNYPNPFNPVTTIAFDLARSSHVTLEIFDMQGREIATLVSGTYPAGRYEAIWDATSVASGVYMYRLRAGAYAEAKTLILLK